jgi:hypothetical protein
LIELNVFKEFDSIEVWSDGGPHHFKTRYCQFLWHTLNCRFNITIIHNFFASYHGHSLCDSHAAQTKQAIKKEYISSEQQRMKSHSNSIYWGPASAKDIQMILTKKIQNTKVEILNNIDRNPAMKPHVGPIKDIKQQLCFVYKNFECFCYGLTAESTSSYPTPFTFKYI